MLSSSKVLVGVVLLCALVAQIGSSAGVLAAPLALHAGTWGPAIQVPGRGIITSSDSGVVQAVSCPSAHSCTAAGNPDPGQPYVVVATNGNWGTPEVLPGIASLDAGGGALIASLVCTSVGNCEVVGAFSQGKPVETRAFVDTESGGVWGVPSVLAGTVSVPADTISLDSLSCATTGNCAAGGSYFDANATPPREQPLVVSQVGGIWGAPIQVTGQIILGDGNSYNPSSRVVTVSCGAPGSCAAGGYYSDPNSGDILAFLVNEVHGTWTDAFQVPGTSNDAGSFTQVASISCTSAGNCSAGGGLVNQPFLVDERNGTWGTAFVPRVIERLDGGQFGGIASVSCATDGNCAAGGSYVALNKHGQGVRHGFVVDKVAGMWKPAQPVRGTVQGLVTAVSCSSPGECSAGGTFVRSTTPRSVGVVVNEVDGVWSPAIAVRRAAGLSDPGEIAVISCGAPGACAAGGFNNLRYGPIEGIVTDEQPRLPPSVTGVTPSRGPSSGGTTVTVHGRRLADTLEVDFGAVPGRNVRSISATSLVVTSPPGAGTVVVRVVAQAGTSSTTPAGRFTYMARTGAPRPSTAT